MSIDLIKSLRWRGLIHQCTDEAELIKRLGSGPQSIYIGFDPTADSLHIGSMMQLMMLRRFQQAGHRPIALVGGATGMIGDPSGKSEERNLLSLDQLRANVEGIASQMRRFLDFDGPAAARIVNNFDWMSDRTYLEFLRDVGKHFPVGAMLSKDSVKSRLGSEAGLSYTEFSYMLLQAYDFVHLAEHHDCMIQAGGSDQWGNIVAGIELGRRMASMSLVGLTVPLLLTSAGQKMGKTQSGAVWLDPNRTSPYTFYQYWINVDDADVMRSIAYLSEIKQEEYDSLARQTNSDPGPRAAQKWLAENMTLLVHGDEGLLSAQNATQILFGGEIGDTSEADLLAIFADVPSSELPADQLGGEGYWIISALRHTGLCQSGGDARRAIKEGSIHINNVRVTDDQKRVHQDDLAGRSVLVLRRGKRKHALLRVV